MNTLNAVLTSTADSLLEPLARRPLTALLICSAATGVLVALVYRGTSNQPALNRVADRSQAELLAINLFYDSIQNTFACFGRLCVLSVSRLYYSLPPFLVMFVPFTLLLSQLALRYEFQPLTAGETVVVELQLARSAWPEYKDVAITVPRHLSLETPAVRDPADCTITWRLRINQSLPAVASWQLGPDQRLTKSIPITPDADQLTRANMRRATPSLWQLISHPGEPTIAAGGPVLAAAIELPHRSTPVLGFDVPWWLTFFVATIGAALLSRPVFRIRF